MLWRVQEVSCIQQGKRVRTSNKPENPHERRMVFSNSLKGAAVVHSTEANMSLCVCVCLQMWASHWWDAFRRSVGRCRCQPTVPARPSWTCQRTCAPRSTPSSARSASRTCRVWAWRTTSPWLPSRNTWTSRWVKSGLRPWRNWRWVLCCCCRQTVTYTGGGCLVDRDSGGGCLVDRDSGGGCLVDKLRWWVFGGQRQQWWVFGGQRLRWWVFGGQKLVVDVWWTETVMVGVWWTDCNGGCLMERLQWGGVWWTDCGGECLVDRMMVGVWWTDTGSRCLVDRDCGGGHLVDRHWWWVFGGRNLQRNGGGC